MPSPLPPSFQPQPQAANCTPAHCRGVLHPKRFCSSKGFLPHVTTGCLQGDVAAVLKCWLFFGQNWLLRRQETTGHQQFYHRQASTGNLYSLKKNPETYTPGLLPTTQQTICPLSGTRIPLSFQFSNHQSFRIIL